MIGRSENAAEIVDTFQFSKFSAENCDSIRRQASRDRRNDHCRWCGCRHGVFNRCGLLGEATMQGCSVSFCVLCFGQVGDLLDRHAAAARVLVLVGVFLVGYAEAMILKSRGVASVTWL